MKKIFTLFLGVLFVTVLFAQDERPTDLILKTETKPVIDGVMDEGLWDNATINKIDLPFGTETPTLGESGETVWRALWDDDGIYVLVSVTDDVYLPGYTGTGAQYMYDKPEVYFDVNFDLADGGGAGAGNGHHQFSPNIEAGKDDGQLQSWDDGAGLQYAFLANDPNYVCEYFVPFSVLTTRAGGLVDIEGTIGFDVTMIDNDESSTPDGPIRQRAVWANVGAVDESWNNMDDCGYITLDGAEVIFVEEIGISVDGNITSDNQTLQITSEVAPEDANDKTVVWDVKTKDGSRVRASISKTGVITPVTNEELIIVGWSSDGFVESNEIEVSITNQIVTKEEVNYIKNGNFDVADSTGVAGAPWSGGAVVIDGVASMTNPEVNENPWGWTFGQVVNVPWEIREETFTYSFRMWSAAPREVVVDFEDTANGYPRYGVSSSEYATREGGGKSDWLIPITTEPTVYTLQVSFDNMLENATQKMNYMLGWATPTVFVDSVYLVSDMDMDLISTGIASERKEASFSVYPNPESSKLHVQLSTLNTPVTIYNSIGVIMEEVVVTGTKHEFDVSRYPQGMYFVKADDSVVKFIR